MKKSHLVALLVAILYIALSFFAPEGLLWFSIVLALFNFIFLWSRVESVSLSLVFSLLPASYYLFFQITNSNFLHLLFSIFFFLCTALFLYKDLNTKTRQFFLIAFFIEYFIFVLYFSLSLFAEKSSLFLTLPLFFMLSFLFSFASLRSVLKFGHAKKIRLIYYSFLNSLILTELFFILPKLPFNFMNVSFLIFLFFYFSWDLTVRYFAGILDKRSFKISVFYFISIFILMFAYLFIIYR